jgi:ATP-dependent DNA helicase RecG
MDISTPIEKIPKIGSFYQKRLKKLGINNLKDLLFHFPHRYEDFSKIVPISQLKINENYCVKGKILKIENIRTRKRGMFLTQAVVSDETGAIKAIWFNQPYLKNVLRENQLVCLAGKLSLGSGGCYLSNPIYEKIRDLDINPFDKRLTHTGRIIPIYPETEGLSSRWLRFVIKPILEKTKDEITDPLPDSIIKEHQLLPINLALWQIHFPDNLRVAKKAQQRFSFQELFLLELFVLKQRIKRLRTKSISIPINLKVVKKFIDSLPFSLTGAQKKAAWQILKDMEKTRPMSRLLQGDVGSGKTIVATIAALNVAKSFYQVAFMAPTEILAKQHFETVSSVLKNFGVNIGLLTSKTDKFFSKKLNNQFVEISKKKLLEKTAKGEIDILIGTHSLIQDQVKFKNLGLVIVDEQHRFGVEQRARLCQSSRGQTKLIPHLLSMTATPIPRTLALTVYGDLDLSILDELPKGQRKVKTIIVLPSKRKKAYELIKSEIEKGRQAFVICPRIEKDQKSGDEGQKTKKYSWSEVKAVKEEYEKLTKEVFPELKIGMLHGKLSSSQKEKAMKDFRNKKIDILVSTSVVEVGIDIPNATVMIVEGAERFGLAQLHQFRGRIGRAGDESYFILFTESRSKNSYQRLKALTKINDGLALAEVDLKLRGPGEFVGTRQWGIPDLTMSSLSDLTLIEKTREAAKEILEKDPDLKKHPLLKEELRRFKEKVHLE